MTALEITKAYETLKQGGFFFPSIGFIKRKHTKGHRLDDKADRTTGKSDEHMGEISNELHRLPEFEILEGNVNKQWEYVTKELQDSRCSFNETNRST